jgi:hypothetical protein
MSGTPLIFGLDLGQVQAYSALACVEMVREEWGKEFNVLHLHRWPLGTPYTAPSGAARGIVEDVAALLERTATPATLVVDATGQNPLPCRWLRRVSHRWKPAPSPLPLATKSFRSAAARWPRRTGTGRGWPNTRTPSAPAT